MHLLPLSKKNLFGFVILQKWLYTCTCIFIKTDKYRKAQKKIKITSYHQQKCHSSSDKNRTKS